MGLRVFAFDTLPTPITKGFPALLYAHGAVEPCVVSKLLHSVSPAGLVEKDKQAPRALAAGKAASVVITLDRAMAMEDLSLIVYTCRRLIDPSLIAGGMAMEEFETNKALGRFMLRAGDVTVGQGMVTKMQPG